MGRRNERWLTKGHSVGRPAVRASGSCAPAGAPAKPRSASAAAQWRGVGLGNFRLCLYVKLVLFQLYIKRYSRMLPLFHSRMWEFGGMVGMVEGGRAEGGAHGFCARPPRPPCRVCEAGAWAALGEGEVGSLATKGHSVGRPAVRASGSCAPAGAPAKPRSASVGLLEAAH